MNTNLLEKIDMLEEEIGNLKTDLLFASAGKAIRFMEQTDENVIMSLTINGNNIGLIKEPEAHLNWCIKAVNNNPEAFFEIPVAFRSRVFSKIENPTIEQTEWFIKSAPSQLWEEGKFRDLIPDAYSHTFRIIKATIVKWFFYWVT